MAKKVLILSGSPRKGGNSDTLCDQFMKGAQEAGNEVEKIWVQGKKVAPCLACYYCTDHKGECAIFVLMLNSCVDCDCNAHPADPAMKDIGILASTDPVALSA